MIALAACDQYIASLSLLAIIQQDEVHVACVERVGRVWALCVRQNHFSSKYLPHNFKV